MNNIEAGLNLLKEAKAIYAEAERALKEERYNLCVRRAQEAVELSLKGCLRILGIEYPKVRDVGKVFALEISKKLPITKQDIEAIKDISARLEKEREPAFYFERVYTEEDALRALNDSEFVLTWIRNKINSLGLKIS